MPTIEVPGHGDVEFPDSMPQDQILAALKRLAPAAPEGPGRLESLGRGAAQGATLGLGDEAQGLVQAAGQKLLPESMGGIDYGKGFMQLYRESRDTMRKENEAARAANPKTYFAGEVGGGLAPSVLLPTGAASAALQGATQGVGYSNADSARGLAGDILLGGGLGVAGHAAGTAISKAGTALAGMARGKAASAAARAGTQAAEESADALKTLSSQYGSEVQKGSRQVENLMRLEQSMTPQQKALFQQLQASGVVPDLQHQVAQSTLEMLPDQAAAIASRKAALDAAQQGAPQAIAARTAELSQPQILKDAGSFAKSYAEPLVAATLAPAGLKPAAAILFGRTRAGKALMSRIQRPGNQIAAMNVLEGLADFPNTQPGQALLRLLTRTAPAAALQGD